VESLEKGNVAYQSHPPVSDGDVDVAHAVGFGLLKVWRSAVGADDGFDAEGL